MAWIRTVEAEDAGPEPRIDAMRAEGLSDEDFVTVNLVVSYYNFVNRIAEGRGVGFAPEEVSGCEY